MQLLGLYIIEKKRTITKVLEKGWYPFGDYKRPANGKAVKTRNSTNGDVMHSVYQDELLPEITVNCIVGKNGAGKSTLLDIIYRMINNLSVRMLGKKGMQSTGRHLTYARGLKADLYFVCEETQYKLSCRDWQTTL